jgi:ubiquinol-cytochrome c reductase iron-sulfur subunit
MNQNDNSSNTSVETDVEEHDNGVSRRDFLTMTACAVGAIGAGAALLPFVKSMNPAADVLAQATLDVELSNIAEGTSKVLMWRGKPVFIRHRTKAEIEAAKKAQLLQLIDPQTDDERFSKNPSWLIVVGVCTHLGCVPNERRGVSQQDESGGWLCACHGSMYDGSGRVIRGPAPKNLEVPPYQIIKNGSILRIG